MTPERTEPAASTGDHFKGTDYVELYTGNALQAMHYYRTAFGFTPVGYAGPETGMRDRVSYTVRQGEISLVLTSALDPESPIAQHVNRHGDGVKDLALAVDDVETVFSEVVRRGARPVLEPQVFEDDGGRVTKATIAAYGDTEHSFIQREGTAALPPGHRPLAHQPAAATGLEAIDHVAVSVEAGTVDEWAEYYRDVLGFHQSFQEDVVTDYSAMNSKVMQNRGGRVISVLVEPAPGRRRSPVEEFLTYYRGAGVHHVALAAADIIQTIRTLRDNGVEFTSTPGTYYDVLEQRVGPFGVDVGDLREQHVLVDRDEWGHLMQIFSKPVQSRPTFFFEIIQRVGARGFGSGNIKALFEAIEREQLLRGNA